MENNTPSSPFFATSVFGQNPFEYKGEVYRLNPTGVTVEQVLKYLTDDEKSLLKKEKPKFFSFPKDKQVIVGIVDRVFDDPLLGGVEATKPEDEAAAKEANDYFVSLNGIEFHREYYYFMGGKQMFEGMVKAATGGRVAPDELSVSDFLFMFTVNFFAKYLIGKEQLTGAERVTFFRKAFDDMNVFDYVFLGQQLPTDRTHMHFLVWEK